MINISTTYMGLHLKNPLIVSSSKLTEDLENIKLCAMYGAGAIVLKSIFEEQIRAKSEAHLRKSNEMYYWYPEAKDHVMGLSMEASLDKYLDFVKTVKASVEIPVIASINCISAVEWTKFARAIQDAGADALELNISIFPFDASLKSSEIEDQYLQILVAVKKEVTIPVSVKLGSYFTNLCSMASQLVENGASGLVFFNRFFRPDIDINTMEVVTDNHFSQPEEQNVPLRWIALMAGRNIGCDLVASTGIHYHIGMIKLLLAGATAVQVCSTLYINGIPYIETILKDLREWMKEHHFNQISDFRGKALQDVATSASFERIQFIKRDFED
ncbi:MAG: dihydroorotate dehydrogenase-like protein [Bacteroidetes bacterium]|nr:dihydroorotate dehydrogenase-like protein [Bacteroidota bacterium]